eukprot:CAMPEP_0194077588 /NCGR_PEP_ID=MMETSP0149-20130528/4191_1 /TAXON_ID=122233 /ORGANISM="Chaetoceros debilis, Strain MM31A-1" /LENGTH=397 /DNA_ID=CAMNT_0038758655 /DNA_START=161 /DNA_END=1351 /DNA_ORIENTATION=-
MEDWQPLYLSSIAGASTCIGAAVVFCLPPSKSDDGSRNVPPGMMAFSLALAGSVMVTVSVISIIPECLLDDERTNNEDEDGFKMIPIFGYTMLCRVSFFILGCVLYFMLSLLFVAEPEELMNSESFNVLVGAKAEEKDLEDRSPCKESSCASASVSVRRKDSGTCSRHEDEETKPFLMESIDGSPMNVVRGRKVSSPVPLGAEKGKSQSQSQSRSPSNNGKVKNTPPFNLSAWSTWTTGKDLQTRETRKAWRVAMLLFVSLLVHNFPEGLAVAASAMESKSLGITVTIGIMIHNIPEGIAIAIPCLAARPDQPWLSFFLASISGLAEPLGAFVALIFLRGVEKTPDTLLSLENILAFVAGIMVIVAMWELFPEALRHTTKTKTYFWLGTVVGVVIMV